MTVCVLAKLTNAAATNNNAKKKPNLGKGKTSG